MTIPMFAKLGDNYEVLPCDYDEWLPWAREHLFAVDGPALMRRRLIAKFRSSTGIVVSTVFIGMNASPDKPTWFETRVFGGPLDGQGDRYGTCAEAEAGHARMVERVKQANRAQT